MILTTIFVGDSGDITVDELRFAVKLISHAAECPMETESDVKQIIELEAKFDAALMQAERKEGRLC